MITRQEFIVTGLDCANEVKVIRAALAGKPGIASIDFDLVRHRLLVEFDTLETSASALLQIVRRAGFAAHAADAHPEAAHGAAGHKTWFLLIAALAFAAGAALQWFPTTADPRITKALLLASILLSARFFAVRAWQSLRQRQTDMNVLVTLAAIGAIALGEWVEGAAVAWLFAMANLLEAWSAARVQRSIERFLDLAPATADRIDEATGNTVAVPVEAIRAGDALLVKPGARIPVDATIEDGHSTVDQASLTGESTPLDVQPETLVFAGSTNGHGTLRIRATKDAAHSRATRLRDTILEAQKMRSPTELWVERFSRVYTPLVLALAVLVAAVPSMLGYDVATWIYNALVVILVACPCALVISTPVTMVSAITALARNGILVRGGESVERAGSIRAMAFDKTGVLTAGTPRVTRLEVFTQRTDAVAATAAVEQLSEHPIAAAFVRFVLDRGDTIPAASQFRALPGMGGEGNVAGEQVWVGSPSLAANRASLSAEHHAQLETLSQTGTVLCAGSGNELWLAATLEDALRPGAARALTQLRHLGLHPLLLLSGDHSAAVEKAARESGVTAYHARLLPEDKLALLRRTEAEHGRTAMVGDGINDAPAMAAAAFSIAAGDRASEVTLQAADAVIWDGSLQRIPWLLTQSRRAMAIVRQNVILAIASKLAFVALAFFGLGSLWLAVLADVGATLLVTFNGLRMLTARQTPEIETSSALLPARTSS